MKKILFYSSVSDISFFDTQKFYQIDISLLKNLGFDVKTTNKKSDFLKFWKYDISFLYFYKWSFIPAILSRLFFKKVYFTGGIDDLSKDKSSRRYKRQKILFKICYRFSTKCFIVSTEDYKNTEKIVRKNNKLLLSLHTLDINSFIQNSNNNRKNNFFTIAWMKNIDNVKRKGIDKALLIFSKLSKDVNYADSIFYIAGTEGEGSDYLKNIIKEKNITNVVFLGNISENKKIELLHSVKYYFQLSEYEGFGLAALEALAAGCIVIHSGQGGLKDGIASDGIIIDIFDSFDHQIETLSKEIRTFNIDNLERGKRRLIESFSNERRQKDFEVIL